MRPDAPALIRTLLVRLLAPAGRRWRVSHGRRLRLGGARAGGASLQRLTLLSAAQGLLLDLDAATLTVWVNGERKGVMARPGMTDSWGNPIARLEGPLRWAVDLTRASVAIAGPLPPPS